MESIYKSDVVIVGSGISGLTVAISLYPRKVTLVTKRKLGEMSSSAWAQGVIAAAVSEQDSPQKHFEDTIKVSAGLIDENSVKEITSISAGDSNFGDKLDQVSGNLSELNNVYEMQLKGASAHLKASEEMYSGINELMSNLHSSLEDTRKYKETMSELTTNLASLNTVYGNMLSAMNVNG